MLVDPLSLIGQTVEHLEMVSVLLADESDPRVLDTARTPAVLNYQAAADLCHALMPRLRAAAENIRASQALELLEASPWQRPSTNCDEFTALV